MTSDINREFVVYVPITQSGMELYVIGYDFKEQVRSDIHDGKNSESFIMSSTTLLRKLTQKFKEPSFHEFGTVLTIFSSFFQTAL